MNDDMFANDISNRVLYDLLMGMKQDIVGMKQDIEGVKKDMNRRFNEVDRRFNELDARIGRLEAKVEKNTERIEELFLRGDKQQITFSRTLLAGNAILAAAVAFIVAIFTGQFVIKNY